MKKKFDVTGMTCASCQAHVQRAVESLDGVESVNVNLLKNNMVVEYDEPCSIDLIVKSVQKAGYGVAIPNKQTTKKDYSLIKLIISIVILLVIMYFSMGNMMWGWPSISIFDHQSNPLGFALLQLILTIPVVVINYRYFVSGFIKLFKGHPNMDTLIAIGASFSIIYGIYCLFMIGFGYHEYCQYLYFESASMILTFVSLGKYLENISKRRTTRSIEKLINLAPQSASILKDDQEVIVNINEVKIGDVIIVRKGDSIPVDGIIIEGSASIDQSNITGESLPVYKTIDNEVFSSTTLTTGYLKIKATKVGEDTSIATIIRLVDEASNSKAPISKLADKISGIFVPVILIISLITFGVNFAISRNFEIALNFAITVVVIACPCALGLATPVAIMVGTSKGAENGLLIKNAEILEKSHNIKTVVLDKTGTITKGKPEVVDFESFDNTIDLKSVLYSIENLSSHPLAESIVNYTKKDATQLVVDSFESLEGKGLKGIIDNDTYYIGNLKLVNELGIDDMTVVNKVDRYSRQGKTPLLIIKNNLIVGLITIQDKIKENSVLAIKRLKEKGINVVMLTGDNQLTAQAIADQVGVDTVYSDVYPTDKQRIVNSLKQDDKHLVAMVGDGVNDALALVSADLGIAIGAGSDVAIDSADIVLLRNDLLDVLNVISLSKRTLNTIKLGLFWAFFYNFVCVILATGFLYYINGFKMSPMIGSIAMSISSVSVVLNALTINGFKPEKTLQTEVIENKRGEIMKEYVITVEGMMCQHCVKHVENACLKVGGVTSATASLDNKNVVVKFDKDVSKDDIIKSIVDAGYDAK